MSFTGYVSSHPYTSAAIAGVIVIGLIFVLSSSGEASQGGALVASGPSDGQIEAGLQLQGLQAQIAGRNQELGAQYEIAELEYGSRQETNRLSAALAMATLNSQENIARLQIDSTNRGQDLQGAIALSQITAQTTQYTSMLSNQTQLAQIQSNAIVSGIKAQGEATAKAIKEQGNAGQKVAKASKPEPWYKFW